MFKALCDPGAELNLIRKTLIQVAGKKSKLRIHAREKTDVILTNNGVEIGRVTEAVYLSFRLDELGPTKHEYREWFYVWDKMEEEMILGAQFCKEHGYTTFHLKLTPYDDMLSSCRTKRERGVDAILTEQIVNDDHKPHRDSEEFSLLPDPQPGCRDRIITTCEKLMSTRRNSRIKHVHPQLKLQGEDTRNRERSHLYRRPKRTTTMRLCDTTRYSRDK